MPDSSQIFPATVAAAAAAALFGMLAAFFLEPANNKSRSQGARTILLALGVPELKRRASSNSLALTPPLCSRNDNCETVRTCRARA